MNAVKSITTKRLVPVAVIPSVDEGIRLAEALLAGGLNIIEVTLRTDAAKEAIKQIGKRFPEMCVGVGTVLDKEVLAPLVDDGIQFVVSPAVIPSVIEESHRLNLPIAPGVVTPTEVATAMSLGCKLLKFFPAEAFGGINALKALAGPFGHTDIQFVPTGGINLAKLNDYLSIPAVAAVGGSWFVDKKLITNGEFDKIAQLTKEALEISEIK
jgi:2-dehydro-3-deoxyphosphogluconate aldolase/(4S)-4-hydroxy-2-oxoglutarate aldolase